MSAASPTVVSFYAGGNYYAEAAERLSGDCKRLGLSYDITELSTLKSSSWIDLCRYKVRFYLEMHIKHGRPILWLDVDSRLLKRIDVLDGATFDMAAFLRGIRYLRDFDTSAMPRMFSPFALYFAHTERVTKFLNVMCAIEQSFVGPATDDFFLQEAWIQHRLPLSVLLLPPDLVGREWPLSGDQSIFVGISGRVSANRSVAAQHEPTSRSVARRIQLLTVEAEFADAERRTLDAKYLHALARRLQQRGESNSPDDAPQANSVLRFVRSIVKRTGF